jgi:hypothetical protein
MLDVHISVLFDVLSFSITNCRNQIACPGAAQKDRSRVPGRGRVTVWCADVPPRKPLQTRPKASPPSFVHVILFVSLFADSRHAAEQSAHRTDTRNCRIHWHSSHVCRKCRFLCHEFTRSRALPATESSNAPYHPSEAKGSCSVLIVPIIGKIGEIGNDVTCHRQHLQGANVSGHGREEQRQRACCSHLLRQRGDGRHRWKP